MPAIDDLSADPSDSRTEVSFQDRQKKIASCLLTLAARVKSADDEGHQSITDEYELAVASLAELIHHAAFYDDASSLVPLAEIAIRALKINTPNIVLATELILEIEGRLFMHSEIPKVLSRRNTQRVSSVDVVSRALPSSCFILVIVVLILLLFKWVFNYVLGVCPLAGAAGAASCKLVSAANPFFSAAYIMATAWGFFGGLASVMLRSVTAERLRLNELRGLFFRTIYKPWLGSIFAVIVYFGVTAKIVPILPPDAETGKLCFWGILAFAAGFGERMVPDLVTKLERSIGS